MGSFYTSHTVRGPSQQQIVDWLGARPAFVSAAENHNVTVLDAACESQDMQALVELGSALSAHFACPVLALLNHDDDLLCLALFEAGREVDQYNSNPGMFDENGDGEYDAADGMPAPQGGDAVRLAAAFGVEGAAVESALRGDGFVMAVERHQALAAALGLPAAAVGMGYEYADAGDCPSPGDGDAFVRTGEE